MKLTFHQWCDAIAAAIIILGILFILHLILPPEAHASELFSSEGSEYTTYNCDTEPQVCEEANREIEEEDPPSEAERIWLEEYPLYIEQEPTHGQSVTSIPTTGLQGSIPPRIVRVSAQASLQPMRTACALHQPHRTRAARRRFTVCHHSQQTH